MSDERYWVGTDVGGTFTDMVVIDGAGAVRAFKCPTIPEDRSRGVMDAFALAADALGLALDRFCGACAYVAHGTTAATNALIERKGQPTALLTTRGFADTLLVQRAKGSWTGMGPATGHYSVRRNPAPIVPRELIFEVDERIDRNGETVVALDREQVRGIAGSIRCASVEAVAVCFLWSLVNDAHEQTAAAVLREELPGAFLTLSSEIAPVIGEYERTATTVVNSYLGPVIERYVGTLEGRLREAGFGGEFAVMDSGGGVLAAAEAAERSIGLLMSGPAGGVLASAALARRRGLRNVITADMGGTSFDAGLIVDGEPVIERVSVAGSYHLATPRVQVTAIGSGGGSIASVDADGLVHVGPESAGADPGPACYGKGGARPTVTDADLVLGIIDPGYFLGGRIALHADLAAEAIRREVAEPLGLSVEEAAAGIRRVADNQMADLLRKVTVEQGHDPRDFTLFAYGGAGPTHAYAFAEEAGIARVVVPGTATAHSAYGAVSSDRFRAFQISDPQRTPPMSARPQEHLDVARVNRRFRELEDRCRAALGGGDGLSLRRVLSFRFRRQTHELPIPVPAGTLDAEDLGALVREFHTRYEQLYGEGTSLPEAGVELGTYRVEGRVPAPLQAVGDAAPDGGGCDTAEPVRSGVRSVRFGDATVATSVYRGEGLGGAIDGPAILELPGTTVVVGPRQSARLEPSGAIEILCGGRG
jgi:N-methylhydantoinase A